MARSEVFLEQMVKRGDAQKDARRRLYIVLAGILIMALVVILGYNVLILAGPIVLMIVFLMGWIFWRRAAQEYEYIYTDGALDIDVVYSKATRKHLFSVDCRHAILIAPYGSERAEKVLPGYKFDKTIYAISGAPKEGTYLIIAEYMSKQCLVYCEPDERILAEIKAYCPRNAEIRQEDLEKTTPSYWEKKEEEEEIL